LPALAELEFDIVHLLSGRNVLSGIQFALGDIAIFPRYDFLADFHVHRGEDIHRAGPS